VREELNVADSPEQKFSLFTCTARAGAVAVWIVAVNVVVVTEGFDTHPPVAMIVHATVVPFVIGLNVQKLLLMGDCVMPLMIH